MNPLLIVQCYTYLTVSVSSPYQFSLGILSLSLLHEHENHAPSNYSLGQ